MIGTGEIIVIMGVVTLLFGGKKLPEFARNLGKGLHEFKKAAAGGEDDVVEILADTKETIKDNDTTAS